MKKTDVAIDIVLVLMTVIALFLMIAGAINNNPNFVICAIGIAAIGLLILYIIRNNGS